MGRSADSVSDPVSYALRTPRNLADRVWQGNQAHRPPGSWTKGSAQQRAPVWGRRASG